MADRTCECGAQLDMATTVPGGRLMPVEHDSAGQPGGDLAVWRDHGQLLCRVLGHAPQLLSYEIPGKSHWARCPHAPSYRRKK